MAKKNKSWIAKIFFPFFKTKTKDLEETDSKREFLEPKNFSIEFEKASKKWKEALPTKQKQNGVVWETESLKVTKTNERIFRLEGQNFSLVAVTESSLYKTKDNTYGGILIVKEGKLNQAIQIKFESLDVFLQGLGLDPPSVLSDSVSEKQKKLWEEVMDWPRFWKEQLILQFSANSLALVCLGLGEPMKRFLEEIATEKQKKLIRDEFFYLGMQKEESPTIFGKNRDFYGFSDAMDEFFKGMEKISVKKEKENKALNQKKKPRKTK